jgi:hypothetical protein
LSAPHDSVQALPSTSAVAVLAFVHVLVLARNVCARVGAPKPCQLAPTHDHHTGRPKSRGRVRALRLTPLRGVPGVNVLEASSALLSSSPAGRSSTPPPGSRAARVVLLGGSRITRDGDVASFPSRTLG